MKLSVGKTVLSLMTISLVAACSSTPSVPRNSPTSRAASPATANSSSVVVSPSMTGPGAEASQSRSAALRANIPEEVLKHGSVVVATDPTYPPYEYIASDGHTIVGLEPDIGAALGSLLGIKFTFVKATFDTIIPGLASGKYDLAMSTFKDTKAREKTVDFVNYITGSSRFLVASGRLGDVKSMDGLCGLTDAQESADAYVPLVQEQSQKCVAAGKKSVTLLQFKTEDEAYLAISTGRADIGVYNDAVINYVAQHSNGKLQSAGDLFNGHNNGIIVAKGNKLANSIFDAMNELMANGTYAKVLAKWGASEDAVRHATINGATS